MKRDGFSLFEILVAMTVCVSGIALVLGALQRADQFTERGRNRIEQQIIGQNLAHRLRLGIESLPDTRKTEAAENDAYWYSLTRSPYPPLPLARVEISVWSKTKSEIGSETLGNVGALTASSSGPADSELLSSTENPNHRFTLVFLMPVDTIDSDSVGGAEEVEGILGGDQEGANR